MTIDFVLKTLKKELVLRNFSSKTIKAYIHYNLDFLKFIKKQANQVKANDIKDYLLDSKK